ncbi:MAG: polyprenol monophosphomannose synthase [Chloroflexi bacterium]|nr:MAG: polyprenol monophosphomannose synthase [Chloroflexota bacterium]
MACVERDAHVPRLSALVVSVVVPTYNEAGSLPLLVARLAKAMNGRDWELVVVDDGSPDGTADVAESLAAAHPVRVVRRPGKAGLASAVLAGFAAATGDVLVVMDADLSHPPERVPALVDAVAAGAELAVGSRYVRGGGTMDWPLRRRIVSRVACLIGNALVPVRDCTSGFFALRRSVVEGVRINAIGFKIGFEVIARGRYRTVVELPYTFRDRELGASKFGRREVVLYLRQLGAVRPIARTRASTTRKNAGAPNGSKMSSARGGGAGRHEDSGTLRKIRDPSRARPIQEQAKTRSNMLTPIRTSMAVPVASAEKRPRASSSIVGRVSTCRTFRANPF